jgi:hypothetical protein
MAVNVTKKVNVAANQRFDKADFDAWQDYFEAMVARLGAVIGAPLIDTNDWLVDGTLEASSITVAGSDLTVVAGCEFMLPSGHIVALADDKVFTGVLPLASASSLMVKVSANDVEDVASADNRRFWSSSSVPPAEYLNTTNTIKQKELDWAIIPTTDLHTYIGTEYTRVATLTTAGVATWQYFFPFSDTYELKSVMGIVRRLIGQNKNSGEDSASNGGYQNTNSGAGSASSGGSNNTNSGINSASSGGDQNTNSRGNSTSSGGSNNTNSGINSASSGGDQNTNSSINSTSSGGSNNTNSGINSASSGGDQNTNSGAGSASSGGINNTNSSINSASSGGSYNTNNGINSTSSGGSNNTNSGAGSASSGGSYNTNSGAGSASSGGSYNTNSGELSCVIGGQYYELADDYCFATGYNTSLTPSGANQNLSHYFNAQTGEVRHLGNFKVGGNVNDGTGAKVVITASSGDIHTKGGLRVGGDANNGTGAKCTITATTGAIQTDSTVTAGEGFKTTHSSITAVDVTGGWDLGDVDASGSVAIPFNLKNLMTGNSIDVTFTGAIVGVNSVLVWNEFNTHKPLTFCVKSLSAGELIITLFNDTSVNYTTSHDFKFFILNVA